MKHVLLALIVNQQNRFLNANDPITHPAAIRLHIALGVYGKDREVKLNIFRELLNLPRLESTKDLTMGQAVAFINLCDSPAFQSYLEEHYGSKSQESL